MKITVAIGILILFLILLCIYIGLRFLLSYLQSIAEKVNTYQKRVNYLENEVDRLYRELDENSLDEKDK